ncbi:acyl-CoA N-acyltransferase [Polychytrium aggregatum]|uniref:acyl-CoA N-acyltransferase n=1 Tax=Polychytrium aggregatum TaxID=110093 RepID=UPI0022FEF5CD|nr:acyl-CoA N-acyltransferase [Polychytrium aggregatum]KAI9202081.1 acyl-CoA N-acyltransferase [Polychytrium aggregatum]
MGQPGRWQTNASFLDRTKGCNPLGLSLTSPRANNAPFKIPSSDAMACKLQGPRLTCQTPPSSSTATIADIQKRDDAMIQIMSDPLTMQHLPFLSKWTQETMAARREGQLEGSLRGEQLPFDVYEGTRLIGTAGFRSLENVEQDDPNTKLLVGEFGMILNHSHWGQGYGTEAHFLVLEYGFAELKVDSVFFQTADANSAMKGFFEKVFGTNKTETHREWAAFYDGDVCRYDLTREQWYGSVRERTLRRLEQAAAANMQQ